MSGENLYEFLERRERELSNQIVGLKGQLAQVQGELAQRIHELNQVRELRANTAPSPRQTNSNAVLSPSGSDVLVLSSSVHPLSLEYPNQLMARAPGQPPKTYAEMTIKELVIRALIDNFPKGGTAVEIRDFIQDAYGRDIFPASIRPQMHRLKSEQVLGHEQSTDTWDFRDGKRKEYASQWFWSSPNRSQDNKDG